MGADQSASGEGWSGPKGGDVQICEPTQHVLHQSAVSIDHTTGDVTAQFTVNLPARGRTILSTKAIDIFQRVIPLFVQKSLICSALKPNKVQNHVLSVEDQHWLRNQLSLKGLIAFVPNGAVLPRASGADDRPMQDSNEQNVVRFQAPDSMAVSFDLPNLNTIITGMGIKKGVSLIVGGGFHGKSTLLSALQLGVYDKIPGDGREFCVCDENAVKIRAEDGRAVTSVDITSFITNLPFGKETNNFTSMDASGSTSQASNIIEVRQQSKLFILQFDDGTLYSPQCKETNCAMLLLAKIECWSGLAFDQEHGPLSMFFVIRPSLQKNVIPCSPRLFDSCIRRLLKLVQKFCSSMKTLAPLIS
jgi:predicted ABC-class ATPase